jgi:patatin-like phospholipase/acyl hydrolase
MEELVRQHTGGERLCDYFDYIGGTSTGAIIAAGLARGMRVGELLSVYEELGPKMFRKAPLFRRYRYKYRSEPLKEQLQEVFGADTDLSIDHFECLLLAVTQNVTTDSPWPISNNPYAKYNEASRPDNNLQIPLWKLVRASTAAPVYFPPETVEWDPKDASKTFKFVDGGVTPYNNPAFVLFRMATHPSYRLGWATGEDKLLLVSVGTGISPELEDLAAGRGLISIAKKLPGNLLYTMQVHQDVLCRTVGRCTYGAPVDREVGDMIPRTRDGQVTGNSVTYGEHSDTVVPLTEDLGRSFLYARYNVDLSKAGLADMGITDVEPKDVQKLDSVRHIDALLRVGAAGSAQVDAAHFGSFI